MIPQEISRYVKLFLQNPFFYKAWWFIGHHDPKGQVIRQKKSFLVKKYGKRFGVQIFFETGTFQGDMIAAVLNDFKKIYSVEIDSFLFEKAKERFASHPKVRLFEGDSASLLPGLLLSLKGKKTLFWLDAHDSKGITGKGKKETPIIQELEVILPGAERHKPIILIDDAHEFLQNNNYPSLGQVRDLVYNYVSGFWEVKIEDNVIVIYEGERD